MIRSLRTGVTGLKSHQVRMDVVGNNIANANTIGYKRSRASFKEVLGQKYLGATRSAGGRSVNTSFVGFGVSVGSIDQNWNQGSLDNTTIGTDLALNGDGFFMVNDGNRTLFTRAGNFSINADGSLVSTEGFNVQGYAIDDASDVDMSRLVDIEIDYAAHAAPKVSENVDVSGNLSADSEVGEEITLSTLVYDEQGTSHSVLVTFTKTANANEWDYTADYSGDVTPPPFSNEAGTVTFDVDGTLSTPPTIAPTWDTGNVAAGSTFNIDIANLSQFSGSSTAVVNSQDGYSSGSLVGYTIDQVGVVSLNFSNGEQKDVFQVGVATVNNPNGLENLGESLYAATVDSGDPVMGRAGQEVQTSVVAGFLEMSNVDLATEFTDMIIAQRGYQASARVVTTSDELLQETVSLKR